MRILTHWTTNDGRTIPITSMEDSHLLNAIHFLRKRASPIDASVIYPQYLSLMDEANRRGLREVVEKKDPTQHWFERIVLHLLDSKLSWPIVTLVMTSQITIAVIVYFVLDYLKHR